MITMSFTEAACFLFLVLPDNQRTNMFLALGYCFVLIYVDFLSNLPVIYIVLSVSFLPQFLVVLCPYSLPTKKSLHLFSTFQHFQLDLWGALDNEGHC